KPWVLDLAESADCHSDCLLRQEIVGLNKTDFGDDDHQRDRSRTTTWTRRALTAGCSSSAIRNSVAVVGFVSPPRRAGTGYSAPNQKARNKPCPSACQWLV